MPFGMPLPQGDNSGTKRKVPKTGADDNEKTKQAGRETASNLPDRDGPAKDKPNGTVVGKPKTSAKAKSGKRMINSMAKSLKGR